MMNVRLKLRESKKKVVPKGPSFRWARTIKSDIDGTKIEFKAPKDRSHRLKLKQYLPDRYYRSSNYACGELNFRDLYDEQDAHLNLGNHFEKLPFLYQSWAFYGPWFTGTVAELSLSFNILKTKNYPEGMSVFHPRAMEQVIGDYLTYLFSRHIDFTRDDTQDFDAPMDWQPLHHLPVNAVRLTSVPRDFSPHKTIEHLMFFPILDDLIACLHFMPSRLLGLPRSELDKRVSVEPMYELMDNIINSIELELSPEAKVQQERALKGMDNTELVKDYPPLKWDKHDREEQKKIDNMEAETIFG